MLKQGDLPSQTALYYSVTALVHAEKPDHAQRLIDAMAKREVYPTVETLRLLCFRLYKLGKYEKAEKAFQLGVRFLGEEVMFREYTEFRGEGSGSGLETTRAFWLSSMQDYQGLRQHLETCEKQLYDKSPSVLFRVYNGIVNKLVPEVRIA
jgi:hypothetical protein